MLFIGIYWDFWNVHISLNLVRHSHVYPWVYECALCPSNNSLSFFVVGCLSEAAVDLFYFYFAFRDLAITNQNNQSTDETEILKHFSSFKSLFNSFIFKKQENIFFFQK